MSQTDEAEDANTSNAGEDDEGPSTANALEHPECVRCRGRAALKGRVKA